MKIFDEKGTLYNNVKPSVSFPDNKIGFAVRANYRLHCWYVYIWEISPNDIMKDYVAFYYSHEFATKVAENLQRAYDSGAEEFILPEEKLPTISKRERAFIAKFLENPIANKKEWSEQDHEEFVKLCAPLVEFIQQRHDKCNPYSWIIIQWNGVAFMPDSHWYPFKVPD